MLNLYKLLSKQKPNTKLGVTSITIDATKPYSEPLSLELGKTYEGTNKSTDIGATDKVEVQQMCNKHYPPSTRE